MGKECILLNISMDPNAEVFLGHPIASANCEVCVDNGEVYVASMIKLGGEHRSYLTRVFMRSFHSNGLEPARGAIHVSMLILDLYLEESLHWLFKQLLIEIAFAIEAIVPWSEWSLSNPVDGHSLLGGSRWDQQLLDHLAMGEGCGKSSSSANRAAFPAQHMRSFLSLCKGRLKSKKKAIQPTVVQGSILSRYLHLGTSLFLTARDVSIAGDASRIGGKDMQLFLITAKMPNGEWISMWAPPQVHRIFASSVERSDWRPEVDRSADFGP